jgi:hypothetical protein
MGVGDLWYGLVNPVFGDRAVVEPEDVDVRAAPGAGFADHVFGGQRRFVGTPATTSTGCAPTSRFAFLLGADDASQLFNLNKR